MKKIVLLTLGAALIATPAIAAQAGGAAAGKATLTRAEAQTRATQMFAKLDANKDGKLDATDRAARRAEMQAKRFEALDANKDGSVSKAEWDKHAADRVAKRGEKRAAAGEARDGQRHAMRGPGKRGGHRMGGWMKPGGAGGAGDKAITQADFVAAALARFDRLDANKDGQVTAEERQAQRTAWKAKADERRAQRGAAPATK